MAEITVGLDFGTHQTKVCIERSSAGVSTYEFFDFANNPENPNYCFPSVVQINQNDKFEYGEVEIENSHTNKFKNGDRYLSFNKPKPIITPEPMYDEIPNPPELQIPPTAPIKPKCTPRVHGLLQIHNEKGGDLKTLKPNSTNPNSLNQEDFNDLTEYLRKWKQFKKKQKKYNEDLRRYNNLVKANWYDEAYQRYEKQKQKIIERNEHKRNSWLAESNSNNSKFKIRLVEFENKLSHLSYLEFNENLSVLSETCHYKYFKLAYFQSESAPWEHDLSPDILSVLYLTSVLFQLDAHLNQKYWIQIGVPSGLDKNDFDIQENRARKLISCARKLIDNYQTFERFLDTNSQELIQFTKTALSEPISETLGCSAIPEAFAALRFVTGKGFVSRGMSLLVDIGGGTADIALFTLADDDNNRSEPDIHTMESAPKGLNHIFERIHELIEPKISLEDIQEAYNADEINSQIVHDAWSILNHSLNHQFSTIRQRLLNILMFRAGQNQHNKNLVISFFNAMQKRPIIFTGGGSMKTQYLFDVGPFSDKAALQEFFENANINIVNRHENINYAILGTSYGLSMATLELPSSGLTPLLQGIIKAMDDNN